jgi:hypothetical protein
MGTRTGLWIDHKKAVIVAITDKEEDIRVLESRVEKQLRRGGDSPLKGRYDSQQVPADDSRQRTFTESLGAYYDAVIASIRDAEAILLFGPGEAKDELKTRLEKDGLGGRIVCTETTDKMTDGEIAARVRQHFPDLRPDRAQAASGGGRPRPHR